MGLNLVRGNRLTLLKNGAAFFPALEAAIDAALTSVHLETYIFSADETGRQIAAALSRAALRGVEVRVLIDGFGSRGTPDNFYSPMRQAGVRVVFFRPEPKGVVSFRRSRLRRTHRKLALVDRSVGFVGGINIIGDLTESMSSTGPRYDYAVQVEGPLLAEFDHTLQRLWRAVTWWRRRLLGPGGQAPNTASAPAPLPISAEGRVEAALVVRDNLRFRRSIEVEYRRAIGAARSSVLIVSPYFLPGRKLRRALRLAARRGVRVELLLQGVADHPLLQLATRALYDQLLAAGVIIHEYDIAMLHGKVAVVDDHWATVGSSNLDPFSLVLNREANIVAHDAEFARALRASVDEEIAAHAHRLSLRDWQNRGWWARAKSWSAYQLARLVAGLVGLKHD